MTEVFVGRWAVVWIPSTKHRLVAISRWGSRENADDYASKKSGAVLEWGPDLDVDNAKLFDVARVVSALAKR